jgi:hypothetical protein
MGRAGGVMQQSEETLFLWVFDEFCPDYSDGLAFAIAPTLAEAKRMIWVDMGYEKHQMDEEDEARMGPHKQLPLAPVAFHVWGGS